MRGVKKGSEKAKRRGRIKIGDLLQEATEKVIDTTNSGLAGRHCVVQRFNEIKGKKETGQGREKGKEWGSRRT